MLGRLHQRPAFELEGPGVDAAGAGVDQDRASRLVRRRLRVVAADPLEGQIEGERSADLGRGGSEEEGLDGLAGRAGLDDEDELLEGEALEEPVGLDVGRIALDPSLVQDGEGIRLRDAVAGRKHGRPDVNLQLAAADDRLVLALLDLADIPSGGQRVLKVAGDVVAQRRVYALDDVAVSAGAGVGDGEDIEGGLERLRRIGARRQECHQEKEGCEQRGRFIGPQVENA